MRGRSDLLDLMDKRVPVWKLILLLAWPAIVEQVLLTIVNYVDTAMVGSIGVEAMAAVGVNLSTLWMLNGLMSAVGVGYSVLMARRIGEGRTEEAREVIRQAVLAICVLGALLTAAVVFVIAPNLPLWMGAAPDIVPLASGYLRILGLACLLHLSLIMCSNILRCAGDTRTPMKFNLMANAINVAGNFMLIYPTARITAFGRVFVLPRAGWGVYGAAAATAFATAFAGAAMLLVLFRRKSPIQISLRESFRPNFRVIRQAIRLAVPVALERVSLAAGQLATTAMIAGLGTLSLAAHQLACTGEAICYLPPYGFSVAGTALAAQSLGAGDEDRAFRSGQWCIRLGVFVMLISAGIMYGFAGPIIGFFTNDAAAKELGARMLRLVVWAEPFMAAAVVIGGILRGAGDVRWPVYISAVGMLAVRVPAICLLIRVFGWDLSAVWGMMIVDWVLRAVISLIRFHRRRWVAVWR